jgi:hypothetical protein
VTPDHPPRLPAQRGLARPRQTPYDLPVVREAFTLPLVLLTVAGLGGLRVVPGAHLRFEPPSLVSLLLGVLLLATLVNAGALAPDRLVSPRRNGLANASGGVVLAALFLAAAQVFTLLTPTRGLLSFVFAAFFLLLLWNTLAVGPDRRQLLRSYGVIFGGAFLLKFVVLSAVYDTGSGLLRRVMLTVLEGVSLGALGFDPDSTATGYVAFAALALFLFALVLLPGRQRRP